VVFRRRHGEFAGLGGVRLYCRWVSFRAGANEEHRRRPAGCVCECTIRVSLTLSDSVSLGYALLGPRARGGRRPGARCARTAQRPRGRGRPMRRKLVRRLYTAGKRLYSSSTSVYSLLKKQCPLSLRLVIASSAQPASSFTRPFLAPRPYRHLPRPARPRGPAGTRAGP